MAHDNIFDYTFTVRASLAEVAEFHHDTRALPRLTPPPVFVQIQDVQPMAEGSRSEFTLWFGPLPLHWIAEHSDVDPLHGFKDTQIEGPMAKWEHRHAFSEAGEGVTRIVEHIEYAHRRGAIGLLTRALFNTAGLRMTFFYRQIMTRRALRRSEARETSS